jgi:NitT/TauT family transport system substrate-binding protein
MHPLTDHVAFRPSRRALIAGSAAALLAPGVASAAVPVFRVGTLPFGTVSWAIQTLLDNGFDAANGIKVENVPLASMEASRVAFLSGSVDTIVNDLLFAARLKAEGKSILFLPFSSTEGALMVATASPIRTIADLKGRSIGVGGGPLDKNWLLLRAAAKKDSGLDLTRDAHPVFGATPLLAAKLESGELDCGLLYWNYCARLQAKGYREVTSVEAVAATLGAKGKVALGGFLFQESAAASTLRAFSRAVHQALASLETKPEAWAKIRPLMQAPDEATFEDLKQAFLRGIPHKPRDEEIADTTSLYAIVAKLGGAPLVGSATSLPSAIYVDQAIYG